MYIPLKDIPQVVIMKCPCCGKLFNPVAATHTTCTARHAEGDCCHFGEKEVSEDSLRAILGLLR